MTYKKIKNGQFFNTDTQMFTNHNPFLEGKTMMTSTHGVVNVCDYKDLKNLTDGTIRIIPVFCASIEKRKKTTYANFIDFEYISIGKRLINNRWVDFTHSFEVNKAYFLMVEINKNYPERIKVKKHFVIKK